MNKDQDKPTIQILYHWLLRFATVFSVFFAVQKIAFYLSILNITDPLSRTYLLYTICAVTGAVFNAGMWWWLRARPYSSKHAFLIILVNTVLINGYFLFTFQVNCPISHDFDHTCFCNDLPFFRPFLFFQRGPMQQLYLRAVFCFALYDSSFMEHCSGRYGGRFYAGHPDFLFPFDSAHFPCIL